MPPMKPSEFFKKLGLDDVTGSYNKNSSTCDYNTFQGAVPDTLTLEEFVNTIYKKVVRDNSIPHRYFSERYIRSEYLYTDIHASSVYVLEFTNKILLLQQRIDRVKYKHLVEFIRLVVVHLASEKKVLPKQVLEFLNKIHKTKGNLDDTYK